MRIALAKLLLQKPSLLLLDEPTNHLDLETRNWLENYLHDYPNAFILISHDRYFLDVTVNKTVEVWNKRMHVYHGNYEKYVTQKEERKTQLMNAYKNQRDRIEALEAFINRFRARRRRPSRCSRASRSWRRSSGSRCRRKRRRSTSPFRSRRRAGRTVIEVNASDEELSDARWRRKHMLDDVSFTDRARRPHCAGGRERRGQIDADPHAERAGGPTSGEIKLGHNVLADYFAQDQYKVLDGECEMLDDITGIAPKVDVVSCGALLGCFMFSGDDVFKKLGVLSGGERNRYAMAKMLVSPANLLLLDEPTNHLDLRAKDVLLDAIRNFSGTVLFVSHDRYFIDGLATRVFEVEDRRVHIYPGNYEDYLWRKQGGPEK
jgi:ATP-binding cassette subfamily F protein 3